MSAVERGSRWDDVQAASSATQHSKVAALENDIVAMGQCSPKRIPSVNVRRRLCLVLMESASVTFSPVRHNNWSHVRP